ncbi:MAG: hypothetical protein UT33_C0011G0085 [Candidatus Peregrinibacteria bacterium GW2011_GWC2_39_14]|nr:MAG: hypothetical protein UT33_C0011G0085 [Candidatus Peregrinibacteria bacterium GW2011_GWC2_39_14]
MEAKGTAERLPTLRSIDQIVISRILRHDMMDAISELLSCAYIQSIGKIGPFTAEDSDFLDLFLQKNKPQLIEIRQKLHDGRMKARDAEQEMDALIQNAKKNQIRGNGAEFTKLQLFIDQKKAEITTKAGFLKRIAKGEEISESEADTEKIDILKTEFAKAYNDTARILLASAKLPQQEGDGDLASLQRMLQGLGLSMDAESVQTLPEILAQTTRDLFRLLQSVKTQVDETMELLATMEGRMSLLDKKTTTTDILTPTPAPDNTTTKLAQENVSEESKKAMKWVEKHWRLRADAHDKRKVLNCLVQNFDRKLSTEDLEKMGCKKSKLGTSTTLSVLIKDLETRPELKDGPYTIKIERVPGNNSFATYQFTYKDGAAIDSGTGTDDEDSPKTQPALDEKEKTAEAALAWIEKHWPASKKPSNLKQIAKLLASNYGIPIPSFNRAIVALYRGNTQFAKSLIEIMERINCPYEIIIGKTANPHGRGRSSSTYCFTAKSGIITAQNDKRDDDKKDDGNGGEDSGGSNHGNDRDEGKNDEIKAAIRESLEWIKTNKLDKRGSSLEALAKFLASNYGTSIPSHNEKMNELLANNRTLINRLIKRLEELDCPFKIIVGSMPNPSKKGGHPSNIYCWMAK